MGGKHRFLLADNMFIALIFFSCIDYAVVARFLSLCNDCRCSAWLVAKVLVKRRCSQGND